MRSYWNLRLKSFFNKYVVFNIHESWGLNYVYIENSISYKVKFGWYWELKRFWRTFYFFCLFFGVRPSMVFWWRRKWVTSNHNGNQECFLIQVKQEDLEDFIQIV